LQSNGLIPMKLEDLPEEMQEEIVALKHGSNTIECDVMDALEDAKNLSDFKETVRNRMKDLMGEARGAIASFCDDSENPDSVLNLIEFFLVKAGYKNMGYAQTMPGCNEFVQRFLKDRKILVEIISNDEPDKDVLETLLEDQGEGIENIDTTRGDEVGGVE
jgi:hypothetical protein